MISDVFGEAAFERRVNNLVRVGDFCQKKYSSQGLNLVWAVLFVPNSLDSGVQKSVSNSRRHEDTRRLMQLPNPAPCWYHHTVEYVAFVASKFRGLLDQICTTYGPEVNCVMQLDFW